MILSVFLLTKKCFYKKYKGTYVLAQKEVSCRSAVFFGS